MDGHPTAVFNPVYKSFKFKDFDSTKGLEVVQEASLKPDNLFTSKFRIQDIEVVTKPHPDDSRNIYVVRNASRASDYLEWKNSMDLHSHSLRKDSMDYDLPEFVAFLQESGNCRYFKDIGIDKEVPCEDNCSVENFKFDHNYISCILNSDPDSDSESMGETCESDSSTSTEDDCNKNVTKQLGSKHSKIDGEKYFGQVDYDLSVDRSIKTTISEPLLLVRQGSRKAIWTNSTVKSDLDNANKISRHFINTPMTTMNGREEVPQSEDRHPSEVGNMSTPSTEDGTSERSTEAGLVHKQNPSFGSISLRSNSSTASSESFAFPILAPEWNGSPARMTNDGDQRELSRHGSHRHLGWGMRFLCCKF